MTALLTVSGALGLLLFLAAAPVHATAPALQSPLPTPQAARRQNIIPTPTPTATVTFAAYQVSPLRIEGGERPLLATGGSAIWIGAAVLVLLGGSVVLVISSRR